MTTARSMTSSRAIHWPGGLPTGGECACNRPTSLGHGRLCPDCYPTRSRWTQTVRFLRASAAAERLAVGDPAVLASTGLARPPALVATFSLWQSVAAMRAYAGGGNDPAHRDAVRAHAARPFHHESAFVRFRPYRAEGSWDGREPLGGENHRT
jgi:hypothetical protein